MKLQLKTLTPVHISTGRDLEALDYVQVGPYIHRLHLDKALEIITNEEPDAAGKFADWVDEKIFHTQSAGDQGAEDKNQDLSRIRQDTNLRNFCKKLPNGADILAKVVSGATLYRIFSPFGLNSKSQINEQVKGPDSKPYIPGTSLKGAIKTILAANAWAKYSPEARDRVLRDAKVKKFNRKKNEEYFEYYDTEVLKLLFSCESTGVAGPDAARFSVMKFFHFSDAYINNPGQANLLEVLPVYLYQAEKPPQPQTNPQEVIPQGVVFDFDISVDVEGLIRALRESKKQQGIWRGLEDKVEKLLNIRIGGVPKGDLEAKLVNALLEVLKTHSDKAFAGDRDWLRSVGYSTGKNSLEKQVILDLYELFKNGLPAEGSALKIGWGSGFLSTTIFNALKETNKDFVEDMFLNTKIGVPKIKGKEFSVPNLDNFPKSKRLPAENKLKPDSFLGWVQIGQNLQPEPVARDMEVAGSFSPKNEVKTTAQKITELTASNEKLKLKDVVTMAAMVEGSEAPFILCRILHSQLNSVLHKARYVDGLTEGTLVSLKVNFQKPGKIANVTFHKKL